MNNIKVIINQYQFEDLVKERIKRWINDNDVYIAYYKYLMSELEGLFKLDGLITIDINDYLDNIIINDTYYYTRKKQLKEYNECLQYKNRLISKSDNFKNLLYIDENVAICN